MTQKTKSEKEPKHVWSILCRESIIDRESNVLSLYGVLEEVGVAKDRIEEAKQKQQTKEVVIPLSFEFVSLWERTETKLSSEILVKLVGFDPQGKKTFEQDSPVRFERNKKRARFRFKLQGLKVTDSGVYTFKLSVKDRSKDTFHHVVMLPLEVRFTE